MSASTGMHPVVAVNLVGADPNARLVGQGELTTRSNYVTGAPGGNHEAGV